MQASVPSFEAQSPTRHAWQELPDGRTVQFFVNVETNLVVVDVIDADAKGGIEILRRTI